ncbi:MAG: UDP-N-acetylglucosamine 1-carboxyvinyltransferase [Clostridia bacterium]|nr:UDP-N-acetylglucosamine 1-carboxyvinyltransferase [Clostridia bacterium]
MANQIFIRGGKPLLGEVTVSGMKNAALPILFATVLVKASCVLENIPPVSDIDTSLKILEQMGAEVERIDRTTVRINATGMQQGTSPYELVQKLRGSTYLLGAELGRFGKAAICSPGGCDFGTRPIDQHIKGFEALGAEVSTENGYIYVKAPRGLCGNSVYFDVTSVGATVNLILASVMADGLTILDNAAKEPHIVDLANFLNSCGANITGAGTPVIKIRGVKELHGCTYSIIPDMIQAGTYMVAAAATRGAVKVNSVIPKHVETISAKLTEMGVYVEELDDAVFVSAVDVPSLRNVNIKTLPYPGFPTDMHPQFATLLCVADGVSCIYENIWANRFRYVEELRKMGANVNLDPPNATFIGVERLVGAEVAAMDLRAGAALLIAGLCADGITTLSHTEYIERGYDDIVPKLAALGAEISYTPF